MDYDTDALVVGAGPTGLVMASELARNGVQCRIIDRLPQGSRESKALSIHARTLELFEKMGIVDSFLARGIKIKRLSVYSHHRCIAHVDTRSIPSRYPFMLSLPQTETEHILSEHLLRQGLEVEREVTLAGLRQVNDGVEVLLQYADGQEEQLYTRWLVGCDGPHSSVRHLLGMDFVGVKFEQSFALADIYLDWYMPPQQATFFLQNGEFVGCFPLPDSLHRIIVAYKAGTAPEGIVTQEEIQYALERSGLKEARVRDMLWSSRFQVSQRKVRHYRQGSVFLAGDACHIHSPIAGQGMNTGIQDAFNLAWKLALTCKHEVSPRVLDSYEVEREHVGRKLLRGTELISRLVLAHDSLPSRVRDHVAPLLSNNNFIRKQLANTISQVQIAYKHSPIVHDQQPKSLYSPLQEGERRQAGERAPDIHILLGNTPMRLYVLCRSTHHVLLVFTNRQQPDQDLEIWGKLDTLIKQKYRDLIDAYLILPRQPGIKDSGRTRAIYDAHEAIYATYGIANNGLVLIRPDGYIAYLDHSIELKPFQSYLNNIFTVGQPQPANIFSRALLRKR
ncbi:FAD-dependent monooxygenase [Ktedonospora formicarum]|uniref:Oxygenase n=1 Tax=Ktedonospora formicarum TaxID=2778364 RepID=A0A8J3MVH7_9CHLR|nr:FAD-dependent monooxygenase [Ktedonospora formicarum]GHO49345.1 oxygenase [Ktedonospora formicarum]